ncbi:DUF3099 domain-containing protein [Prescottella subtropica]|uniref:DUF3099 domain-containing protein n=1 Tax=Prescottella subtropica TaxID=2545757 RepID=UPI0010F7C930|nr:DUF3099 domain-containing protein [Prescottella subtropica]
MGRTSGLGDDAESGTPRHPALITEAAQSIDEQHRARVRKYLTIMSFRVPALILAALAYGAFGNAWISVGIIAASVPLPWIAVLIANDRPPRSKDEPSRYDKRDAERELEARSHRTIEG